MNDKKGLIKNYQQYKVEYNILIGIVVFTLLSFVIYYTFFANNILVNKIDNFICSKEVVNGNVNYEVETCTFQDDFDQYKVRFPIILSETESALEFNKKIIAKKSDLVEKIKYNSYESNYLYQALGFDFEIAQAANTTTFILWDISQSYYYDQEYTNIEVVNFKNDYSIETPEEVIKNSDIDMSNSNSNALYRNSLIALYEELYKYSYYSTETRYGILDQFIEKANINNIKNIYINNNKLTFIVDVIESNQEPNRYYKFEYDNKKFNYIVSKNKI